MAHGYCKRLAFPGDKHAVESAIETSTTEAQRHREQLIITRDEIALSSLGEFSVPLCLCGERPPGLITKVLITKVSRHLKNTTAENPQENIIRSLLHAYCT
jgi:hypothetical protein